MENVKNDKVVEVHVCNRCGKIIYDKDLLEPDNNIIIDYYKCPICNRKDK